MSSSPQVVSANAEILQKGIVKNMRNAAEAIATKGKRKQAMLAIDEARRVAKVGMYAQSGNGNFAKAEKALEEVRHSIQNGKPKEASIQLKAALQVLNEAPISQNFAVSKSTQGYEGATLINARGQILGELESTTGEVLRARIGDWQNTLGFIDFGGTPVAIPRNKLVFGKKQTLGYVFVVLAEEINQEEAIKRYGRQ
ncbi:hypothetical protein [Fischerella sp. JS2]|uniref:hypothetical protein n=1 Tax=Fischerella sp. JS2 TaxID=2597771 RepID=UPI0028E3E749|nr:hypothetical protein [Fischerella sp. JS2]